MPNSVTFDDMTVSSNTETADQIRESFAALDGKPVSETTETETHQPEQPEKPVSPESEAGKTLAAKKNNLDKRKSSIQSEIDALVAQRGQTQRERDQIASELATLRAERDRLKTDLSAKPAVEPKKAPEAPRPGDPNDPEPQEDQFETYGQYVKAQARWEARQEIRETQAKAREAHQRNLADHADRDRRAQYAARLDAARTKHADFDARIAIDLPLTLPMQDVIIDSPVGPEIMLHLAEHPEEAEKIRAIPNLMQQFAAMSKLEARLEAAHERGPAAKTHTESQAPAPIKPLASTPGAVVHDAEPDPETCTQAEYDAYWNRKLRKVK